VVEHLEVHAHLLGLSSARVQATLDRVGLGAAIWPFVPRVWGWTPAALGRSLPFVQVAASIGIALAVLDARDVARRETASHPDSDSARFATDFTNSIEFTRTIVIRVNSLQFVTFVSKNPSSR
jgi:hypothetical protein